MALAHLLGFDVVPRDFGPLFGGRQEGIVTKYDNKTELFTITYEMHVSIKELTTVEPPKRKAARIALQAVVKSNEPAKARFPVICVQHGGQLVFGVNDKTCLAGILWPVYIVV